MQLPAHFIDLVQDALLKSFWTKRALRRFLRRCHVSDSFLGQLSDDETKREWIDRLFPKLEANERGQALIQQMARSLADQASFPDLDNWDDSASMLRAAEAAVAALKDYIERKDRDKAEEQEGGRRRRMADEQRQRAVRANADLASLKLQLDNLCARLGTQEGGYAFQTWFYDLMNYFDIDSRRPYVVGGRQIDGSVTIDGTTYLVELKFTAGQAVATDIDSVLKKVNDKADNTMGIMISMSGYSSVAINEASFARSPILLLDHNHLYLVLGAAISFPDTVRRIRRHSSQEGKAYLAVNDFGGR